MKVTAYIRVGKLPSGAKKLVGSGRATMAPLTDSSSKPIPTVAFAIKLDIPDRAFGTASRVIAEVTIPESATEIVAEVVEPEVD